jgi:hypothetical protein
MYGGTNVQDMTPLAVGSSDEFDKKAEHCGNSDDLMEFIASACCMLTRRLHSDLATIGGEF